MQKKSSSQRSTVRVFALTLRAWVKLCQAFRTCQRSIPKQQQAPPAPSSFCPTKETRAQSQAAAFPGMSSAQLLPARTHTLQSLQQLLGRRLGCFFFSPFYSSPPGRCCIYSSSGAARGRVPRSTAAWPMQPSWHRAAPGSHWPSASHSQQSDQWALMP